MPNEFIIDLYTGHESDSIEEFRRRTEEVIHRFNLNPIGLPKEAMYIVLRTEDNSKFLCDKCWNMLSRETTTRGKAFLEQRKKEYKELKINFDTTFIGEI